ncbi:hypothetical protein GALL_496660 [mine drainage metagenome]|uniref:Uncharacterized protein n=1 Tax=mine drainage metagenome TaxID=410659 RepID=A0A1J5PC00_9ZZZZ
MVSLRGLSPVPKFALLVAVARTATEGARYVVGAGARFSTAAPDAAWAGKTGTAGMTCACAAPPVPKPAQAAMMALESTVR